MSASLVSPVFVGRRSERSELIGSLRRAMAGTTQFVLVGGEAGVGKSRLVDELVDEAQAASVRVLSGQCVQLGTDGLPFAPLVDALRVLARSMPREEFDRVLGPARGALLRLLPNIDPQPATSETVVVQGSQLLELVLGLLERLAGTGPVLIVIEDLHWADQSTLDLLAYLVRALRGVPIAVVGTFRSDELNRRHPLRSLLLSWERGRNVQRLDVPRFERPEVADQLTAILGRGADAELLDTVFDRSEGNAFLVEEILGVVMAGGDPSTLPPSLRDVLLSRVDGLGPEAQRLLSTAAVGGRWVSEQLLLRVSGLDGAAAFAGLREAVEQHLLVVDEAGRGYAFRHALGRDAVYDDLLPGERVLLHTAYGEALSRHPELAGDDSGTVAADLAHHWYAALDLPRALGASVEAAGRALERYASAEALQQLERALQIWPRVPDAEAAAGIDHVEVLQRAARTAGDAGNVYRALSLVGQALDELGDTGDVNRRALLLERRATILGMAGKTSQSIEALRFAADLLPAGGTSVAHAVVLSALAGAMVRTGRWREAAELSRQATAAAIAANANRERAESEITQAHVRVVLGDHEAGLSAGLAAIDFALSVGESAAALRGYINLSDTLELIGRSADAVELAAKGRALAARSGYSRSTGAYVAGNEAESLFWLGRYDEAESLIATMLATEPEGVFAATLLDVRAHVTVRQGRYEDGRRDVDRARALVGDQAELQFVRAFAFSEAHLRLADGEPAAALDGLRAELDSPDPEVRYDLPLLWLAYGIHADLAQQARDRGTSVAPLSQVFARALAAITPDNDPARAYVAMCAAEQSRAADARDAGVWDAVAARWRDLHRPYERAESLLRAAEVRILTGERGAAERDAAQAFALAVGIGAAPLADRVAQLARQARLDIAGAAPRAVPDRPKVQDGLVRFGLTQREREVLAMVAAGRTNPEIARTLFISPKTASVHVSNILAKLGVTSRVEAATMAHRLGVATS